MTTIAYRNGIISSDKLITAGNTRLGDVIKIGKKGRVLWGCCGRLTHMQGFLRWVRSGMSLEEWPQMVNGKNEAVAEGIVALDRHIFMVTGDGIEMVETDFYALGSGALIAMGAMASGKSAEQAVRIAARFDIHTGTDIMTLRAVD